MDINGGVECWGRNDVGQTDVPEGSYRQISVGVMNTCGLQVMEIYFAGAMRKMMIRGMWM